MKKLTLLAIVALLSTTIYSCKKDEVVVPAVIIPKVTYNADIKAILVLRCTPCHLAAGTNPNKWDDFTQASAKVATILDRIQRTPGTTGAMPRGATAQIPADEIAKIKQWVADGTLEK
jgi:uncharacterized membrane protein